MKKTILLAALSLAVLLAHSAWATITFTASTFNTGTSIPTTTVNQGGTFDVKFALTVTQSSNPSSVGGTDIFLQALKSQNSVSDISNLFAITGYTSLVSGGTETGVSTFPDTLTAAKSSHGATFVENTTDSGTTFATAITTPITNLQFETLTLSVAAGTPLGTYNFTTTTPSSITDGRGSHITDGSTGAYFIPTTQASFSITVVPEPATWSLIGLGGLGAFGMNLLRSRRKS